MPGIIMSLSADATVATGGIIPFDVIDWSEEWPTAGAGIATVPREGTYMVTSWWTRKTGAAAGTCTMSLIGSGGATVASDLSPTSTAELRGNLVAIARALEGDTFKVQTNHGALANQVFRGARCFLRIARVGPKRWT
jgi:hypothetical protein